MKHNTRRLFTLLTALVCIGLLAGCGTDTAENDTADGGSDAAQDGSTSGDAEDGSDASPEPTGTPSADSGDSTLVTAAA